MRAITVTFVLVFLTGTQARHFWQRDEPQQTPLERFKDMVHTYMETAVAGAREAVAQFDASTLAQKHDLKLAEYLDRVRATATEFHASLAPEIEALRTQLHTDWDSLHQELFKDMDDIKAKMQPFIEDFRKKLEQEVEAIKSQLEPFGQELKALAQQNLDTVHQKVRPVAEDARDRLRAVVDDFRKSITPYRDEVHQRLSQKVQELREVSKYHAKIQQHLSYLQAQIPKVVEKIKEKVVPWVESAKLRLEGLLSDAQKWLEEEERQRRQQQQQQA